MPKPKPKPNPKLNLHDRGPEPADEPAPTHTITIVGTEADADAIAYCLPEIREYRLTDGDAISRTVVIVFEDGSPKFFARTKPDDTLEVVELPDLPELPYRTFRIVDTAVQAVGCAQLYEGRGKTVEGAIEEARDWVRAEREGNPEYYPSPRLVLEGDRLHAMILGDGRVERF